MQRDHSPLNLSTASSLTNRSNTPSHNEPVIAKPCHLIVRPAAYSPLQQAIAGSRPRITNMTDRKDQQPGDIHLQRKPQLQP